MKKQTIEIEVPDGKEAVWKDGKVVFEDIKPQLPRTWEEFCENYKASKGEAYINTCSDIVKLLINGDKRAKIEDRNILPSEQAAEQHLAYMQLHQLRDTWREGWLPDWTNDKQNKYAILSFRCEYEITPLNFRSRFLTFQDKKRADEFYECFRDLIIKAGDLI